MTTLGIMKTRIASEMVRTDVDFPNAAESEIRSAINFYRSKRFWFTEKRTRVVFSTVIGQNTYTSADQPDIPNLIRVDSVTVIKDGLVREMQLMPENQMEYYLGSASYISNPPAYYSYYEQKLRFYPMPDAVYPVTIAGVVRIAAPVDDAETDNPWMTDAEELIRFRAKSKLYGNWFEDVSMAAVMQSQEKEALESLRAETSIRTQVSRIAPDCI